MGWNGAIPILGNKLPQTLSPSFLLPPLGMTGTPMGLPDTTKQPHMTGTATMMTHLLVVAMTRMEPVITTTTLLTYHY